jgi:hypothetical protein
MVDYTLYTTREGRAEGESADAYHVRARGLSAPARCLDDSAAGCRGGQRLSMAEASLLARVYRTTTLRVLGRGSVTSFLQLSESKGEDHA